MTSYKLSIIIPVYNVEPYLEECLNSILRQNHEHCQIILVDDGSTDGSGKICDRYKSFQGFTVKHKENGGLSSARNAGLALAEGEYIAFLDSDDRLSDGALAAVMEWIDAGGADVCFMEAMHFYPDGRTIPLGDAIEPEKVRGKSREEVFYHLSTRPKYPGSACTKLFRRSFLEKNEIRFPGDRRLSEDLVFCLECFLNAESFDALGFPYYEYRKNRTGSISSSVSLKSFMGMASFLDEASALCLNDGKPKDRVSEYALSFAAYEYSIMLWQYSRLAGQERETAKETLEKYRWLLPYGRSGKTKLVKSVSGFCGLGLAAKILDVYMKNR